MDRRDPPVAAQGVDKEGFAAGADDGLQVLAAPLRWTRACSTAWDSEMEERLRNSRKLLPVTLTRS